MKNGDVYRGFKVLSACHEDEVSSDVIHLVHEASGLEVLHLLNNDKENLFSFNFRTPCKDSSGVAHVIEHSVLCGSQRYPLKDPFLVLSKQSVNTFLNAMTAIDRTMYPASSVVKADYFNLMRVYADAVFFPLLNEEVFLQEGVRVEFDKKQKPVLQGVVFNEMKGVYSSFDSVVRKFVSDCLLHKTHCGFDAGGEPLEIANLTYKKFKDFHKKYYCPANCFVFLYGNIDTKEQLDFLCDNVLSRLSSFGKKAVIPHSQKDLCVKHFAKTTAPLEESSEEGQKSVVNLSFLMPCNLEKNPGLIFSNSVEAIFMSELLIGSDCAPVSRALIESGLGMDVSFETGVTIHHNHPYFSAGLIGAKPKDALRIKKIILDTLKSVAKNGISKDDFNRTVLAFEYANREEVRFSSPFSMTYLSRAVRNWVYGFDPSKALCFNGCFLNLKNKIESDGQYIARYINENFLNNPNQSLTVVKASSSYTKKRLDLEKRLAAKKLLSSGKKTLLKKLSLMKAFQAKAENESLIPRVSLSDLTSDFPREKFVHSKLHGLDCIQILDSFKSMTYYRIVFTFDMLSALEYQYVPLLCECIAASGWKGVSWHKGQNLIQQNLGLDITAQCSHYNPQVKAVKNTSFIFDRDMLIMDVKCVSEKCAKALSLLGECITKTDFSDSKRIKNILSSMYESLRLSLGSQADSLGRIRFLRQTGLTKAKVELLEGISQIVFLKSLLKTPIEKVCEKLFSIYKKIIKGGAFVSFSCSKKDRNASFLALNDFVVLSKLLPLLKKHEQNEKSFFDLTELSSQCIKNNTLRHALYDEAVIIPGSVGFAFGGVKAMRGFSKKGAAFRVLCHLLTSSALWQKIRMEGGSYGVYLSYGRYTGMGFFQTYRDPKPFASLKFFEEFIKNLSISFSDEDIEKALTGIYSDFCEPCVPVMRTKETLIHYVSGYPCGLLSKNAAILLKTTKKDVLSCIKQLKKSPVFEKSVVFCPESHIDDEILKNCRKIIKLQL